MMYPIILRRIFTSAIAGAFLLAAAIAPGQTIPATTPPPAVTLSASATASVTNDRMVASLRAESDNADPVTAANTVNTRMAAALARAKSVKSVEAMTSGYTSYQVTEKNQPTRWRVTQTLQLTGSDFAALSALVSQLQGDSGLVVNGINFSVSDDLRRKTEDTLTQQAIKAWQVRAADAARGFGFDAWHLGKVAIQTGDYVRAQPMMRQASAFGASAAPVAVEAGNTDVTVTVSGDATLDAPRLPKR
jgi:predicted secreted protein